jgi:hypothetical protein
MARRPAAPSLDELIALEVRRAFADAFQRTVGDRSSPVRPAPSNRSRRAGARPESPAPASSTPAHPRPIATPVSPSPPSSSANDLFDRVRTDLLAAYEGQPVTPDRLAFRLKLDRELVDAALMVLVRQRQAKPMRVHGRTAYVPVRR